MATKSRNTNAFVKFLCVLLSVICMAGAFLCAVDITEAVYYGRDYHDLLNSSNKQLTLADCWPLASQLHDDIRNLTVEDALSDDDAIQKALLEQQAEMLQNALKRFDEQLDGAMLAYEQFDNEDYDGYEEYGGKEEILDNRFQFNDSFYYSDVEYVFDVSLYNDTDNEITYRDTHETAATKLTAMLHDYISNKRYRDNVNGESLSEYYHHDIAGDLYYSLKNTKTGNVLSNLTDVKVEDVMKQPYALSVINNQPSYSEKFKDVLQNYQDEKTGKLYLDWEDYEIYLYVDYDAGLTVSSYREIIDSFSRTQKYNLKTLLLAGAALFVAAVILLAYYLSVCGKRLENGKVKRAWIDYLPSDVHLVLSAAAITGLVAIIAVCAEDFYDVVDADLMQLVRYGAIVLSGLIWALLIELLSSVVRVCKSEKNFFSNLLVVMLFNWIIIKPIVAIGKGIRSLFTFKPHNFRKALIRWVIAYLLVNLMMLFDVFFFIAADADVVVAIMPIVVLIVFNIVCLVYAVDYVKKLDAIIAAAHTRTVPQVDYNKLPNSLKTLVNSLQYTRQELDAAVNKAVRDERMRTELITNVSHDLKTPLTSIISYVDLLKGCEIEDENAKEYIGVLDEKSNRLKRLIEDLIEASKITSGVITLNPVELSLSELAAQAVYERHQEFVDNGLELVFKGDHGNINAYCDGNKTFRVLENLISNAKKYSARGTRVYCDVYESQNFSIFEIKNISAQPLDITPQELTERFVRGDKSRTNEGNGLGLSIADNLCKAQHGHLYLTIDGDLFKAQVMLPKTKGALR